MESAEWVFGSEGRRRQSAESGFRTYCERIVTEWIVFRHTASCVQICRVYMTRRPCPPRRMIATVEECMILGLSHIRKRMTSKTHAGI